MKALRSFLSVLHKPLRFVWQSFWVGVMALLLAILFICVLVGFGPHAARAMWREFNKD